MNDIRVSWARFLRHPLCSTCPPKYTGLCNSQPKAPFVLMTWAFAHQWPILTLAWAYLLEEKKKKTNKIKLRKDWFLFILHFVIRTIKIRIGYEAKSRFIPLVHDWIFFYGPQFNIYLIEMDRPLWLYEKPSSFSSIFFYILDNFKNIFSLFFK